MSQDNRRFTPCQIGGFLLFLCVGTIGFSMIGLLELKKISGLEAIAKPFHRENLRNKPNLDTESSTAQMSVTRLLVFPVTTYNLSQATVHVVYLQSNAAISVAVADDLAPMSRFVQREGGSADTYSAINGGFFDPQNGKTTSHLIVNGEVVGDPADNERLVGNPNLQQYLPQILNRSEFRAYRCDENVTAREALSYDITFHNAAVPEGCEIESAVGAGPQLLPEDTSEREAFTDYENGELIRDAIGSASPNARSAVGIDSEGAVYFIMVEKNAQQLGFTLSEVSEFAASLGIVKLLNLDGGSSSSLYALGQTSYGRSDTDGNPIERPIKSVIFTNQLMLPTAERH